MDLYKIPNDDGKSYRRKQFLSILRNPELGYVDGATDYCMLPVFADEYSLDDDQRIWLAYLYGLSYSQTTAIRVFMEFPELRSIGLGKSQKFWDSNKSTLYFNPDRKYVKNNDQFVPSVMKFKTLTEGSPVEYWDELTKGGFESMYKKAKRDWYYFGPMGLYLFFDAMYGLLPDKYVDPDSIDWANCGRTVPEGMAHLLYMDELIKSNRYPLDKFNSIVRQICDRTNQPVVIVESTLCAFRKFFKATRYLGYYADRMLVECNQVDCFMRELGIDVYKYRRQSIPEYLLGEVNGWDGIQKDRLRLWLDKGVLYEPGIG